MALTDSLVLKSMQLMILPCCHISNTSLGDLVFIFALVRLTVFKYYSPRLASLTILQHIVEDLSPNKSSFRLDRGQSLLIPALSGICDIDTRARQMLLTQILLIHELQNVLLLLLLLLSSTLVLVLTSA